MKAIIISGALAQDHEFIYPFYRVLEEGMELDVCIIGGKSVQGYFGTALPPNKDHPVKDIHQVKVEDYDFLILPGGYGTLDELFEVISLNQLNIIKKKVVLLNINNFWNSLKVFIKDMKNKGH